jgi:hypothetical protein
MSNADGPGGPGYGYVIMGALVGGAFSLAAGLFVAASLNTWLAVDWVRGMASLAAGAAIAAAMLRAVSQTARGRLRAVRESGAPEK